MVKLARIEANICLEYKYHGYISFKPRTFDRKSMKRLTHKQKVGRLFKPDYPDYPKGIIIDTEIQDLRLQGVNVRAKYWGQITIELIDIKPGGYISVGSLDDRKMSQHQHVYRYRRGRKYHDVWLGMPDGIFRVTMIVNMPKEHHDSLIKTEEMFQKLVPEDVAELEIERIIQGIKAMVDFGVVNDDVDEITKESTLDEDIEQQQKVKQILQEVLGPDDIKKGLEQIDLLEDEDSEKRMKLKEIILENLDETELRKKWARALADIDQELYQKMKPSKKKKESRIRRRARRDHKILKKSNTVLEEIFQVFRYYFNTHIATAKYLLKQYWFQSIFYNCVISGV